MKSKAIDENQCEHKSIKDFSMDESAWWESQKGQEDSADEKETQRIKSLVSQQWKIESETKN